MTVRVLNSLAPKPIASKDSLFAEIDRYIGLKANSPPIKLANIKKTLGHFKDVAGPIRLQDLDSSVWANWHHFVNVNNSWGPTTKRDKDKVARSFMHYLAGKHNLPFGFLKVKEYKFAEPDGNKEQWTLEQVKEALATATDKNRTILLLGLNAGQIQEDITTNIPDMVVDGRLSRVRQKNTWQVKPLKGTWHLWNETSKAMRYDITLPDITRFNRWCSTHGFPSQKGLRKTAAQWIEDNWDKEGIGDEHSRLYRCDKGQGVHHKNYIKAYTPEQIEKLKRALMLVERFLFG